MEKFGILALFQALIVDNLVILKHLEKTKHSRREPMTVIFFSMHYQLRHQYTDNNIF